MVLVTNEVSDVRDGDGLSDWLKRMKPKTERSESQKLAKSQKLSKSKNEKSKKPSKSRNSPNFDTTKAGPSFLTSQARAAFNRLRLAFNKAPILWHFDLEYHIRIEIDVLGYAICGVLSQLASGIKLDKIVTKTDLG